MKDIIIGLLFGGPSAEHEISILSARNIFNVLSKKYTVKAIYIDRGGKFYLLQDNYPFPSSVEELQSISKVELFFQVSDTPLFYVDAGGVFRKVAIDIFFPITHGTVGEDGSLQGFLKLLRVPFVGCDVLSSALCMDKEAMKYILLSRNIPTAPFMSFSLYRKDEIDIDEIVYQLGLPLFVKPARQGSSVGVTKVFKKENIKAALENAFRYDTKILVESYIKGREIECSVLGNHEIQVSIPGEIQPTHDFYSYEAKYLDPQGAKILIPAPDLSAEEISKIKEVALKTYRALYCEGFARVDMFYTGKEIYVNEVNTLPGFTNISMYPKLWEYQGMSQEELLEKLLQLALEKYEEIKKLRLVL